MTNRRRGFASSVVRRRHLGGSRITFVDGDVRFLKASSVVDPNPTGTYRYEP